MPDHESKNENTPNPLEAAYKLGRGLLGELRKMFDPLSSLTNSSTPTSPSSSSKPTNLNAFTTTPSETEESAEWLSNSPNVVFEQSSTSNGSELKQPVDVEREGECVLQFTLSIRNYGRFSVVERQVTESVALAIHRSFSHDSYELFDDMGRRIIFDSYAYDGEHDGHDTIILKDR